MTNKYIYIYKYICMQPYLKQAIYKKIYIPRKRLHIEVEQTNKNTENTKKYYK